MKLRASLRSLAALALAFSGSDVLAQGKGGPSDPLVVMTKGAPLAYPQMAKLARVTGDVVVKLAIRRNGTVISADAVSGSPLLRAAALNNAKSSEFECHDCNDEVIPYVMTYTFVLRDSTDCSVRRLRSPKCLYLWKCGAYKSAVPRAPDVTQVGSHITLQADPACVETISSSPAKS